MERWRQQENPLIKPSEMGRVAREKPASVVSISSSPEDQEPVRGPARRTEVINVDSDDEAPAFPIPHLAPPLQAPSFPVAQPAVPRPAQASKPPVPQDGPQKPAWLLPSKPPHVPQRIPSGGRADDGANDRAPLPKPTAPREPLHATAANAMRPHGMPIAIPAPHSQPPVAGAAPPPRTVAGGDLDAEFYDVVAAARDTYEPRKTADEAENDLRELLKSSMGVDVEEIDMSQAIVEGLAEGVVLRPHQTAARTWMREREAGKKRGGILADDMGLGKTLQTIVRIVDGMPKKSSLKVGHSRTTLVVTPVAVVTQWVNEIKKYAPRLRVVEHHGPNRTKDPSVLSHAHVVVTSYSIVSSEHKNHSADAKGEGKKGKDESDDDDDSDSGAEVFGRTIKSKAKKKPARATKVTDALFKVHFHRLVLDEAHTIKNKATQAAKACFALQGTYKWCLTGTPMQNSVDELYSLIHFLGVRPINDWDTFNTTISKPVKAGRSGAAMKRLHLVLKGIMLRRLKTDMINGKVLIELPPRIVNTVKCEFDDDERAFYAALEAKITLSMNKFMEAGTVMNNYTAVLVLLLRLRQACDHPSLVAKAFSQDVDALESRPAKSNSLEDDAADDLADVLGKMSVAGEKTLKCSVCMTPLSRDEASGAGANVMCADCGGQVARQVRRKSLVPNSPLPPSSAKTRKIVELLREIAGRADEDGAGREKTIIFSQFTTMLDIIGPFLKSEGIQFVRIDGSMPKDQREQSLRIIREKPDITVILISFKAGSTGLNLTSCNNVILVDLWWNPALEEQAFDRAHRLGQERQVNIYKLSIDNTVEDRILGLQEQKRELARAALSGDKLKNNKLGLDDLVALFRPGARDEDD